MQKNNKPDFFTGNIAKLLFTLAMPAIVAQLVNALYNIVDRMYIGHIEGVGDYAITGLGVCFPIIILISAFAAMIGMGGAPLAAIKMGENNKDGAEKILGTCFSTLIVLGVILSIIFLIYNEPLLMMFGASEKTIPYALDYLGIYVLGSIFVMLSLGMNNFITAQGFAKTAMITVLVGAIINIVLDPILIFGFNMGVRGAAIATVISQFISSIWVIHFLFSKKTTLKIKKENLTPDPKILRGVVALGFSPFIMQSTESLVQIVFNTSLLRYGGDLYVGTMTVLGSAMQLALMPIMGITQGAQPIISQNYGAGNYSRVRETALLSIKICFTMSTLMCLGMIFFSAQVSSIFTDKVELIALTAEKMKIFMAGVWIFGIQISCQNTFIALGKAKISIMIALLRKIIILIPLVLIFPLNWGVNGIYFAEPVADILAAITTIVVFSFEYKRLKVI